MMAMKLYVTLKHFNTKFVIAKYDGDEVICDPEAFQYKICYSKIACSAKKA